MSTTFGRLTVIALALAFASAASAQDSFPDVPANHWAYEALARLKKDGLLVGYPDGLYRGARPASRYELAVAMDAAYQKLQDSVGSLDNVLKAIMTISPPNITALKDQMAGLQDQINALKGYQEDIANLKRAADTFEKELEQLGVNVEAMKAALGSLSKRVTALEKKRPPVDISVQTDLWIGMGNSRDGFFGLNKEGRIVGTSDPTPVTNVNPPVSTPAGLTRDATFLHEAAFTLADTNETGPKWSGTFVVSDMFTNNAAGTAAFGNQSDVFNPAYGNTNVPVAGLLGYHEGIEDIYVQTLGIQFDSRFGGVAFSTDVGRLGYKISPYMLQRLDNTLYYSNDRWDNGLYYFDGVLFGFKAGSAKLDVFGGDNSGLFSKNSVELNPMRTGPLYGPFNGSGVFPSAGARMDIDRSLGANLQVQAGKRGDVSLAYLMLDSNVDTPVTLSKIANRLAVYGGDATVHVGAIDVQGGYHKSDLKQSSSNVIGSDNSAWNVRVGTNRDKFSVYGEYRSVEANYLAPGDWGRLGALRNPTNIKGFKVGGSVNLGSKITVSAAGEFDKGVSDAFTDSTFIGQGSNIGSYQVRLDYRLRPNLTLFGAYENTRFRDMALPTSFVGTGDPSYRWTTFGLGYGLSPNARLAVQYELSDVDNDYQVTNGSGFRGGFLTTQLTIKF